MSETNAAEPMHFQMYGQAAHLRMRSANDLKHALALEPAHWVATSAPVESLQSDPDFLKLVDANGDGRITCHEVQGAIGWLLTTLADCSGVESGSNVLEMKAINDQVPEGARISRAAAKILARLGQADRTAVSLDQIRGIKHKTEAVPVSESGVVLPEAAKDNHLREFIQTIIAATGGTAHPSGSQGANAANLEQFLAATVGILAWRQAREIPTAEETTPIMPLGQSSPEDYDFLTTLRAKLDQFFAQCEAAALDARFVQHMGWTEAELQELDFDDPAVINQVLRDAPLARANPERLLPLQGPLINPYYAEALTELRQRIVKPVLQQNQDQISALDWQHIRNFFAPHQAWRESKPTPALDTIPRELLQKYLEPELAKAVRALMAESTRTAIALDNIRLTEKLCLYQAHLLNLANNFVSFPDLYSQERRALFEMGTLVMDGRRFNLAVRVGTRSEHVTMAKTSNMFVMYVAVTTPGGAAPIEVAIPVTAGNKGNLCLGKRGVFYDANGAEYDAKVLDIIDNPISFWEALGAPFRRLGKLITGKIESLTAAAGAKLEAQTTQAWDKVAKESQPPTAPTTHPAAAAAPGNSAGMMMGAGVAVAALGSATAYIAKTLAETSWITIVSGIGGAILLVLLPTAIVAVIKLRKRDLSAILEGSGWAVNARMRLTREQGRFFTMRPAYPKTAKGLKNQICYRLILWLLILLVLAASIHLIRLYMAGM